MIHLSSELRQAIEQAGDAPVEITDPQTNTAYVLVRAEVYRRMQEILEDEQDRREQDALLARSRKHRLAWLEENPY
jgi:PHD/YefM family antitoxin component YafN of YafNO toxin-antitoxin module